MRQTLCSANQRSFEFQLPHPLRLQHATQNNTVFFELVCAEAIDSVEGYLIVFALYI